MKEKNYTFFAFIRNVFTLFLMLLFANFGWGQTAQVLPFSLPDSAKRADLTAANGWSYTGIGTDYSSSGSNIKFDTTNDFAILRIASSPGLISYNLKGNGLSGAYIFQLSESADGDVFTLTQSITSGIGTVNTVFQSNLLTSTRYIKWTYVNKATGNIGFGGVQIAAPLNLVPVVSDVEITGLPNTSVQLMGSYDYADTDGDADASTYKWYTATDNQGTGLLAIDGATAINYTLTNNELGKYIRLGVLAASATGTSPGTEVFSTWIGPVNAAGTPVLNAGLLADFAATCLNATTIPNSFTLMGNNLESNVTVGPLTGFAFSETENGTYTSSLTLVPVSEALNTTIYVKFTPTNVQSYNGTIDVMGGGATTLNVSVVGAGINTSVTSTTDISFGVNASTVTLTGSLVEGCSAIIGYGFEYSTTNNFVNGTGINASSSNINAGNFTASLSGLQSNTTYYYKAYATDGTGTIYGLQSSFTTSVIANPLATAATTISSTSFNANWEAVAGATSYALDVYEVVAGSNATDLFISEYIEGSGNNKAIEIYNGTGASVDLSTYSLQKQNNGSGAFGSSLALTGTIANGSTYVIVNNNGSTTIKEYADLTTTSGAMTFNGNDAVALYNGTTQIDVVGIVDDAGLWGDNVTLVRNASAEVPKIAYSDADWQENATDAFTNLGSHTFSGGSSATLIIDNQNVGNVTSFAVTGLNSATEYLYVVRAIDASSTSVNSNEISVTTLTSTTVYENGVWSNGVPTANSDAIILSDFSTTGNLVAKSLTITSGIFTVATGTTVTVTNAIVNNAGLANFIVENNGVVLQTSDVANTGIFAVKRNSAALYRQDYTLWSSPVSGQNLRSFSPQTLFNRFSSYDNTIGTNGDYTQEIFTTQDMNTKLFTSAKGYLIRMPNNWVLYNAGAATSFQGTFAGTLNNGDFSIALSGVNNKLNLVGNPYPSPISISAFFAANTNLEETLYFWRKQASTDPLNASKSGYATYNSMGFVSADLSINNVVPTNIQTGQGFFVVANSASPGNLVFNNTMRTDGAATFYKSANETSNESSRFWLNLSSGTNLVGQTLIGYADGATQNVDSGIDALYFNDAALALTSIINNNEYIIQGRSLPFVDTDVVSLGFKSDIAGEFTIALSNFDGLFTENQDIYLKDNVTGTLQNLKLADYTFSTQVGVFNNRFEVQYSSTLGTNNPELAENNVLIAVKNQQIKINAGSVIMEKVELIDVSGRVIYMQEGINTSTMTLENIVSTNQVLIVRISTKDNNIVNQKIIF